MSLLWAIKFNGEETMKIIFNINKDSLYNEFIFLSIWKSDLWEQYGITILGIDIGVELK